MTQDAAYAHSVFHVADWCLENQVHTTGAFLTDLGSGGPTFHTAFVAEGIADAWATAVLVGDCERARRYRRSWFCAMEFCRRLIIRTSDEPWLRNPRGSVGGVRGSLTTSTVRIDHVSHLAIALSKGLALAGGST